MPPPTDAPALCLRAAFARFRRSPPCCRCHPHHRPILQRRRKRAERFGIPMTAAPKDDDEKRKKRAEKFGTQDKVRQLRYYFSRVTWLRAASHTPCDPALCHRGFLVGRVLIGACNPIRSYARFSLQGKAGKKNGTLGIFPSAGPHRTCAAALLPVATHVRCAPCSPRYAAVIVAPWCQSC